MMMLLWRGIMTRKLRAALTAIAILLGVAMVSGTFVLTDQIRSTFDRIFTTSVKGVDVVVTPREAFDTDFSEINPLDDSLVAKVAAVPGVKVASGQIQAIGALVVDGKTIKPAGGAPPLVGSALPPPLAPGEYVEGGPPTRPGEVAVDKHTAGKAGVTVGRKVGLTTREGVEPVTVSGIFTFGDAGSLAGATVVVPTFADAQRWYDRVGKTSTILAAAEPGISESELTRRVAAVLPPSAEAKTAAESAQQNADDITSQIDSFLTPALLSFAGVALLVGAFIIFNTFSITVAQRLREIGMLRTLGATKGQIMRSVIGEAAVIGVAASVAGFLLGILFDRLLLWVFDAVGFPIEVSGLEIAPRTVIASLAVGIVVSVLSAVVPALRATRVPPVAAMREGAVLPRSRFARFTPWVAGLLTLVGLALVVQGIVTDGSATQRVGGMALGAVLVFVAVGVLARFMVAPLARVVGWPLERLSAGAGRLARENATRNAARTASTASALMIGVGLVVFVAVFADGIRSSFTSAVDRSFRGDIVVLGQSFLPFPAGAEATLAGVRGVEVASGVRFDTARIDGKGTKNVYGVDPARLPQVFGVEFQKGGSDALYAQLGRDGALVEQNAAQSRNLAIGDTFTAQSPSGTKATYRIIGQYKDPTFANDGFIVSNAGFSRIFTGTDLGFLAAKVAPGQDAAAVETAAKDAMATAYPATDVQSNAEYKKKVEDNINGLLYLFYALLAMSVVISIFGIINTLVLSITERTREIGMLRAIGVTRPQLRRMVRYESIITSVIGAILGLVIGIVFAFIMTKGLEDQGITFSLPEVQLVVFLVLSVIVGILAAVLPARRAARLRVLDAIHYE